MYIWESKLKQLCMALKDWAKIQYKEPEKARNEIKRNLKEVHIDIYTYGVNQEKQEEEKCLY